MLSLKTTIDLEIVRRIFVYLVSGSISALVAFLLLPVLTKYLTPYDYGIVETFTSLTTCLTGVILLGGNTILAKEYFDHEEPGRKILITRILALMCISGLILLLSVFIVDLSVQAVSNLLKISASLVYLAVIVSFLNALIALVTTFLQVEKRAFHYALFVNSKTIVEILISLTLIVVWGLKCRGELPALREAGFFTV